MAENLKKKCCTIVIFLLCLVINRCRAFVNQQLGEAESRSNKKLLLSRSTSSSLPSKMKGAYNPFSGLNWSSNINERASRLQILSKKPRHIAFICDGNSRWSHRQNDYALIQTNNFFGHSKGGIRALSLVRYLLHNHKGVKYVTMYGFSSENWSRPQEEIDAIWRVMEKTASSFYNWSVKGEIRLKALGDTNDERIPESLRNIFQKFESDFTPSNNILSSLEDGEEPFTLCIAVNYGGRKDIINASRKMAEMITRGEMTADDIDIDTFENLLCTAGIPDPDLVIRTGGEKRLSNFLLWNCAYSEFYFSDLLWPDFDEKEIELALEWYQDRERRFGGRL